MPKDAWIKPGLREKPYGIREKAQCKCMRVLSIDVGRLVLIRRKMTCQQGSVDKLDAKATSASFLRNNYLLFLNHTP